MLFKLKFNYIFILVYVFCFAIIPLKIHAVPVQGFVQPLGSNTNLPGGEITILETDQKITPDIKGQFSADIPVGQQITLKYQKKGYLTLQTGTFVVPPQGFTGSKNEIAIQVVTNWTYGILKLIWEHNTGKKVNDVMCHVLATVTAYGKTLNDCPQGETDSTVYLDSPVPNYDHQPLYIGIFTKGPLACKTNPFTTGLKKTTADGGVLYINLPPSNAFYTFHASKPGKEFTDVKFWCKPGVFINLNPPHGPTALS